MFKDKEVQHLFSREENGQGKGGRVGKGDGQFPWESLGWHRLSESSLPPLTLEEVSHFRGSGNILFQGTEDGSHFIPLSPSIPVPSPLQDFSHITLDQSSQGYPWSLPSNMSLYSRNDRA